MTAMRQRRPTGALGQEPSVAHIAHSRQSIRITISHANKQPQYNHKNESGRVNLYVLRISIVLTGRSGEKLLCVNRGELGHIHIVFRGFFMKCSRGLWPAFASLLFMFCSAAQASIISWTYQATVSNTYNGATSPDLLGIDAETLSFTLLFDDTKMWSDVSGWLYFPPYSVLTTISGNHSLSLNSSAVSAAYGDGCCATIVEQSGSRSYVDLVIDGSITVMSGNGLSIPNGPVAGNNLSVVQLPSSLDTFSYFEYTNAAGLTARYNLANESISAAIFQVPEPQTSSLIFLGLVAFAWLERFRKHPVCGEDVVDVQRLH